ncbi:MAG: OmpH family outer membrane protein, partial [Candidatus Delongbacteria bacterium]
QENQKRLQQQDMTAQSDFIDKVRKVADKIAKKKGYHLVLAKEQVIYIKNENDITDKVIKIINK